MYKDFFFNSFVWLLMTLGLAEKQMLAFCLSACVINNICISSVLARIQLYKILIYSKVSASYSIVSTLV